MSKLHSSALVLAVMFAAAIMPGLCPASHPNHVSNAEVNWNPKSGNFEIALCVWPADLEKALALDQSKPIDLDKVENLDELLKSYVEKKFLIRPSQSQQSSTPQTNQEPSKAATAIRWVGHERDLKAAWLYFEIEGDTQGAQWTVENRIFFELNEDQLNQLQLTVEKTSSIVVCRFGESRFEIDTSVKSLDRRRP
jgi:hypothetical protein